MNNKLLAYISPQIPDSYRIMASISASMMIEWAGTSQAAGVEEG